jgi:hypothetical protein
MRTALDEFYGRTVLYDSKGRIHCDHGPAIHYDTGDEAWYRHGRMHREGGPALIIIGKKREWWDKGIRHRTDGPAVERANGEREWWFRGRPYASLEAWLAGRRDLTAGQRLALAIIWSDHG